MFRVHRKNENLKIHNFLLSNYGKNVSREERTIQEEKHLKKVFLECVECNYCKAVAVCDACSIRFCSELNFILPFWSRSGAKKANKLCSHIWFHLSERVKKNIKKIKCPEWYCELWQGAFQEMVLMSHGKNSVALWWLWVPTNWNHLMK